MKNEYLNRCGNGTDALNFHCASLANMQNKIFTKAVFLSLIPHTNGRDAMCALKFKKEKKNGGNILISSHLAI